MLPTFDETLTAHFKAPLLAGEIHTLQVNVGKLCNQACHHCHVDAGPHRTEIMTAETAHQVLDAIRRFRIPTVDITGGAPELNANFRDLVIGSREAGAAVIVRHNLTIQFTEGFQDLPEFFCDNQVQVVASLPYFRANQTDAQRGRGVFDRSIEALIRLNAVGYGVDDNLPLNLVYNPVGAFLAGDQAALERDFKRELIARHGISFHRLFALNNMPISRFLLFLERSGNYERYMDKLVSAFNPSAVDGLMCRGLVSVGWDGRLYDCDFNQMLELDLMAEMPNTIADFDPARLAGRTIITGRHCFGCTAGAGSSCGGAVA